jgi:tetratricopeptide (TPR) repeat protein
LNLLQHKIKIALPCLLLLFSSSPLKAEHTLDVTDPLVVARNQAFIGVKNGSLTDALSIEEKALKMAQDEWGPTHPSLAPILTDLATIDRYLGRYSDAEASLNWALALRVKAFGPEDPSAAESLGQLASLYADWGRWDDAEYYAARTRNLLEKSNNDSSTPFIQTLNELGAVDLAQGKTAQSESWFKESLKIQDQNQIPDKNGYIQSLTRLSEVYRIEKNMADAQNFLEKALETAQKSFPADSLEVADAAEALGVFFQSQNKPQSADPLLASSLKIYQHFVGDYYGFSTLPFVSRLAKAYSLSGNNKQALDLLTSCLKIRQDTYGEKSVQAALTLMELSRVEKKLGADSVFKQESSEALTILKGYFTDQHPLVKEALLLSHS